ncbi:MAG: hypothetical protein ABSF80_09360 [Chitinispirillaceae bacterium]|jgi:hypothetical protein
MSTRCSIFLNYNKRLNQVYFNIGNIAKNPAQDREKIISVDGTIVVRRSTGPARTT